MDVDFPGSIRYIDDVSNRYMIGSWSDGLDLYNAGSILTL